MHTLEIITVVTALVFLWRWMVSPFVQGAGARVLKEPRSVCQYKNDDPRRDEWLEGWYFVCIDPPISVSSQPNKVSSV
jgi:hypothetical protein